MPQASESNRVLAEKYFGDPIAMEGPLRFLSERGFILGPDWHYRKPNTRWEDLTEKEKFAILFLCDEWDFAGWEQTK